MIDLHIHTKYSDGKLQVNEILQRAKEQNITVISICDHNVLGAYMELSKMDITKYNMKIITGIEFDFVHNHKDFHMLGYNFDWRKMNESSLIDKRTEEEIIKDEREKLNFLKSVCKKMKLKVSDNLDIKSSNDKASTIVKYDMMKYEENNDILNVMLGENREKSFARGYVHNPNSPFYIDETIGLPTAKDVADLIHTCGGEVFLAHPFDYKDIDFKAYIQEIYDLRILDGIECVHTRHSLEQIEYIKHFCEKHNLKISGGSDFHRDIKQKMGYGVYGTFPITEEYYFRQL